MLRFIGYAGMYAEMSRFVYMCECVSMSVYMVSVCMCMCWTGLVYRCSKHQF